MQKFLELILGTADVPTYLAAFVFAIIGMLFVYRSKIQKRDKNSPNTPRTFSLKFFLHDNLVDIVFSLLAVFLALRFSVEYAGVELTMWYALAVGLGITKFVDYLFVLQGKARSNE